MSELIQVGPSNTCNDFPLESLGKIFYKKIKEWDCDRILLIDSEGEITYGEFQKLTVQLAKQFQRLGIRKGDVITIISPNHWRFIATIVAGFYIGATINLLNYDYTSGELKHLLLICNPVLILCTKKSLIKLKKLENEVELPHILLYDSDFDSSLKCSYSEEFKPIDELDPMTEVALILTSSGTTGFPKCVQLTHSNMRTTMLHAMDPTFLDLNKHESWIAFLPFYHVFGCAIALASILSGCKTVIMEKFIPDLFLTLIQNHKITKLFVVPPILQFLVKNPLVEKFDLSSVTDILCGAAVVRKELEEMVQKKFQIKSVRQVYGMTEVCGGATMIPKNFQKYGSSGKVMSYTQIKVCDVTSEETLSAYQIGEIRIKGYYDEEGYFYIVDRLKEIIKYKGFQVSPAELENLLIQHPAVNDAAVVGLPDERAGELPLAFVVKQDKNITEKELIQYISENISKQKHLYGGVRFIESIPKSPSGKILRIKLKEML
ncbi:luciferin 4-monooxygenase-like isoform X2 [Tribolium madens]|uniref:luciferin 4-monooxygenase-like isoform X2 n=1 Tax=Tribolium madens TaxID=41895 RepID=UPI001CF7380D|nr:luciferin 4-monooxygenase-like isoform X2 [Tribolium madens]